MKRISRISTILFAIMLAFASIGRSHEVPLLKTIIQDTEGGSHTAFFSEKKLNDVFSIHRQSEQISHPVNSLPAPGSKILLYDFAGASFSLEQRIQTAVLHELALSNNVDPSLSISVIIFPFHYFW